jgi:hypothetical protein
MGQIRQLELDPPGEMGCPSRLCASRVSPGFCTPGLALPLNTSFRGRACLRRIHQVFGRGSSCWQAVFDLCPRDEVKHASVDSLPRDQANH